MAISSPLARAQESAAIIAEVLGLDGITTVAGLREWNSYGVLSGVPKARAKEIFDYILSELKEKPGYSREPLLGAEDFDEFVQRVKDAFDDVVVHAQANGIDRLVILTHGKFTQALCEHVFKIEGVDLGLSGYLAFDYVPARVELIP